MDVYFCIYYAIGITTIYWLMHGIMFMCRSRIITDIESTLADDIDEYYVLS